MCEFFEKNIDEIPEDSVFDIIELNQLDFYAFLDRNSDKAKINPIIT